MTHMTYEQIDTLVYDILLDLDAGIAESVLVDLIATQSGTDASYIEESLECLITAGYVVRTHAGVVRANRYY